MQLIQYIFLIFHSLLLPIFTFVTNYSLELFYLKVEAFFETNGTQYLGGDGARQHVEVFHSSSIRVLLFPAAEHPPAKQCSQLITTEQSPLSTDTERERDRQRLVQACKQTTLYSISPVYDVQSISSVTIIMMCSNQGCS